MRVLALPISLAAALSAFALVTRQNPVLVRTFLGFGAGLLLWTALVYMNARKKDQLLSIAVDIRRQHWLQACAQTAVLLYWGYHARIVYTFLPFILAQLIFAYAFDALLSWSRRGKYTFTFGPFPIILSINLFLWFRLDWFYWQFALIALGYLAKEFIRWNRDGKSAHIFNPSSFPLAIAALGLLLTGTSNITYGFLIANTQFDTPYMYVVIFLAALPGQILFGVARMTLSAVVALYAISVAFFATTGTYLFYDVHIPVPVFLGMHLLFTDPSTSPRTELGRFVFGVLYATGTALFFVLLSSLGEPTFYDKLLPVPLMNLMVRGIDRLTRKAPILSQPVSAQALRRNAGFTALWALIFAGLYAIQGVGEKHPGQYLPFWQNACQLGSERACNYSANLMTIYCNTGSGWACNEVGILRVATNRPADADFKRACELGFDPGCQNANATARDVSSLARGRPEVGDLPIILRGTKPPLKERDPSKLYALACEQGWTTLCRSSGLGSSPKL
jgi:hypothetical protein